MPAPAMKRLIVNADDFGRTAGINAGTLEAHLRGIVTSATTMVLEDSALKGIRDAQAERAPRLSLGLHFAATGGGRPAAAVRDLPTLAPGGRFARRPEDLPSSIPAAEVRAELEAQIEVFQRPRGQAAVPPRLAPPRALHPSVAPVFAAVARERSLPVRAASDEARRTLRDAGVRTPDAFLDGFRGAGVAFESLERILEALPDGMSELMCHPAEVDDALRREARAYADEREREIEVLCDPSIRARVRSLAQIELVGFDELWLPDVR